MSQHPPKQVNQADAYPGSPTIPRKAAVASGANNLNGKLVSDVDVRLCAYLKWEAAGKPVGDGLQFWLEAEQELMAGKNEKLVESSGWQGHRENERLEAEKAVKDRGVNVDSHYRDNNRMFQSHGERGHRHGGNG